MSARDRLRRAVVAQFHRPTGAFGALAGLVLARRPSNRARNAWVVERLAIRPDDHVLELGFGPGLAIADAARRAQRGRVVGLDHSEAMHRMASRRNRAAVREGRVELVAGAFAELARVAGAFDAIFAVNAVQFDDDPAALVRALAARLRPGGRLAIATQSRRAGASDADSLRAGEEAAAWLRAAGLARVRVETLPLTPACAVCAIGERASAGEAAAAPAAPAGAATAR